MMSASVVSSPCIRPPREAETQDLVALAMSTGLFTPEEAELLLRGTLDDFHAGRLGDGHVVLVVEDPRDASALGWAYASRNPKSNGVWDLWWIGIAPRQHGRGLGSMLLSSVEDHARGEEGRVLVIETSASPALAATRRFYAMRGYAACGTLPDFYADGDAKVTFAKSLRNQAERSTLRAGHTVVRGATAADLPVIVELAIALGRQHEGYDPARFVLEAFATTPADLRSTYRAFFEQVLEDTDAVVQVGERNGEVLGYVFGRIEEASFLDLSPRAGWIHDVFVGSSARGEGLGDALLSGVVRALRERGAREIMLTVSPKNERARALFERRGFGVTMLECRLGAASSPSPRAEGR